MNDCKLYFARRQMHDQFDLFFVRYIDKDTGVYHKVTGFDGSSPILTGYEFKGGDKIEPLLTISGPFFHNMLGKDGMEEFIENLCSVFNYAPKVFQQRLRKIDELIEQWRG